MTNVFPLATLFHDLDWKDAKIHVAQYNGKVQPLDVFAQSFDEWRDSWNGKYQRKHYWNRPLIFSIIELPKQPDLWLFGGVFRVAHSKPVWRNERLMHHYTLEDTDHGAYLIGRLVISWVKDGRPMGRLPESILADMAVAEIRPVPYAGEDFPGHANISHSYAVLEKVWAECKPDWRVALESCSGIYLITDVKTGRRYVGSAYGDEGIYSRWAFYFKTGGHGGSSLLKKLLGPHGVAYARKNFVFSLLEQLPQKYTNVQVIERENFWKQVLLTRGPFGLNEN